MSHPTGTTRPARLLATGFCTALGLIAFAMAPPAAQARVWVSVGGPFPGYYGPGPYYGYYPPSPYDYPATGYYPPSGYYPPPNAYPPAGPAPSAYAPPPAYAPQSSATVVPPAPAGKAAASPKVTYTSKPAFTNSAGQSCREYKTTDTAVGRDVYGTACKQADGQWRVVN